MVNKVILIGNVGTQPEVKQTSNGNSIATITLATSDKWKDKHTGEQKETTEWHRVVVLSDGLVRVVGSYVQKGSKIYIEGKLQTRKWQDKDGQGRYTTEIVLSGFNSTLKLLDGVQKNTDRPNSINDDDIPF